MAVRMLSMVWDGYPGGGGDLLAMLALADWSDDGGKCYPSMASIARKIRLSECRRGELFTLGKAIDEVLAGAMGNGLKPAKLSVA